MSEESLAIDGCRGARVSFLHGCCAREALCAPLDGSIPMHTQVALRGLSGLQKRTHGLGRKSDEGIQEELGRSGFD